MHAPLLINTAGQWHDKARGFEQEARAAIDVGDLTEGRKLEIRAEVYRRCADELWEIDKELNLPFECVCCRRYACYESQPGIGFYCVACLRCNADSEFAGRLAGVSAPEGGCYYRDTHGWFEAMRERYAQTP